jgi:hypothetical protein
MSNCRNTGVCKLRGGIFLFDERTQKMFSNGTIGRNKPTIQNLIDQAFNAGLVALIVGSIAAAMAIGGPVSAGGTQPAIPVLEWRSLLDQHVVRAPCPEPCMRRLVGAVGAPVGQGWG